MFARPLRLSVRAENSTFEVVGKGYSLERFEVEYEKKNLQVKVRGGRKYNFTEKSGNADALFVFHQKVDAAMKRLADD